MPSQAIEELQAEVEYALEIQADLWMIILTATILLSLIGFIMFETGVIHSYNEKEQLRRFLIMMSVGAISFALFGFGFSRHSHGGIIGVEHFLAYGLEADDLILVIFFYSAGIWVPILSTGSFADRISIDTHIFFVFLSQTLMFPLVIAWTMQGGWLEVAGYKDFAAAAAIHLTSGIASLIGLIYTGSRPGVFQRRGEHIEYILDEVNFNDGEQGQDNRSERGKEEGSLCRTPGGHDDSASDFPQGSLYNRRHSPVSYMNYRPTKERQQDRGKYNEFLIYLKGLTQQMLHDGKQLNSEQMLKLTNQYFKIINRQQQQEGVELPTKPLPFVKAKTSPVKHLRTETEQAIQVPLPSGQTRPITSTAFNVLSKYSASRKRETEKSASSSSSLSQTKARNKEFGEEGWGAKPEVSVSSPSLIQEKSPGKSKKSVSESNSYFDYKPSRIPINRATAAQEDQFIGNSLEISPGPDLMDKNNVQAFDEFRSGSGEKRKSMKIYVSQNSSSESKFLISGKSADLGRSLNRSSLAPQTGQIWTPSQPLDREEGRKASVSNTSRPAMNPVQRSRTFSLQLPQMEKRDQGELDRRSRSSVSMRSSKRDETEKQLSKVLVHEINKDLESIRQRELHKYRRFGSIAGNFKQQNLLSQGLQGKSGAFGSGLPPMPSMLVNRARQFSMAPPIAKQVRKGSVIKEYSTPSDALLNPAHLVSNQDLRKFSIAQQSLSPRTQDKTLEFSENLGIDQKTMNSQLIIAGESEINYPLDTNLVRPRQQSVALSSSEHLILEQINTLFEIQNLKNQNDNFKGTMEQNGSQLEGVTRKHTDQLDVIIESIEPDPLAANEENFPKLRSSKRIRKSSRKLNSSESSHSLSSDNSFVNNLRSKQMKSSKLDTRQSWKTQPKGADELHLPLQRPMFKVSNRQLEFSAHFGLRNDSIDSEVSPSQQPIFPPGFDSQAFKPRSSMKVEKAPKGDDDSQSIKLSLLSQAYSSQKLMSATPHRHPASPEMSHKTSQTTNTQGARIGNYSSASSWTGMDAGPDEIYLARRRNLKRFKKDFPEFAYLSNDKVEKIFKTYQINCRSRKFKIHNPTLMAAGIIFLFVARLALNLAFCRLSRGEHSFLSEGPMVEEQTLFNSLISGAVSSLTTTVVCMYQNTFSREANIEETGYPTQIDILSIMNSLLAGTISTSACAHNINQWSAMFLGFMGALIYHQIRNLLRRLEIDDPLEIVAVHGSASFWSIISTGIFDLNDGFISSGKSNLLVMQIVGGSCIIIYSSVISLLFYSILWNLGRLRISTFYQTIGVEGIKKLLKAAPSGGAQMPMDLYNEAALSRKKKAE